MLVAEVEEGKEEDRQEEGEEVKRRSQVEETTTTWMAMMMVVSGVRTRLELEPNVSVDEIYEACETLRAFSGCTCGCACCEAPRQSLMCSVCLSSASSLVFTSLCFRSHLLLSTLSSQFSYCISSSNSLTVAIFHICFHNILTAFQVWYLHLPSVTVDRRQL